MTRSAITLSVLSLLVFCSAAAADQIVLEPQPRADLYDLDHSWYYTWGIDTPWAEGEQVVSAKLEFTQIRNWKNPQQDPNDLYVHLLDDAALGVSAGYDFGGYGDKFQDDGTLLVHYHNLPQVAQDLAYDFTADQLDELNFLAADGRFALAFDPDCHYYNDGVKLTLETAVPTPEPAAMVMLAIGAMPVAWRRLRTRSR